MSSPFLINKILFVNFFLVASLIISSLLILKTLTYDYYPDFSSYYYNSLSYLQGGNPYLKADKALGPFLYPPSALLIFLPLTKLTFVFAQKVFTILSLLSFLFSLYLLLKFSGIKLYSRLGIFLILLAFNFFPAKFTLGMGQINNFVLFFNVLFVYFYTHKRDVLSGMSLALAIALKVSPLLLLIFLIITRKWKMFFATLITLMLISAVVYFSVSHSVISYFFRITLPGLIFASPGDYYNQSLSGFLIREVSNSGLRQFIAVFSKAALFLLSIIIIYRYVGRNEKNHLLGISILSSLSLILSGISWQHHYVWILIPLFLTFIYINRHRISGVHYIFLGLSYLLVAINVKIPLSIPILLQSHVLYGAFLLYILDIYLMTRGNRDLDVVNVQSVRKKERGPGFS